MLSLGWLGSSWPPWQPWVCLKSSQAWCILEVSHFLRAAETWSDFGGHSNHFLAPFQLIGATRTVLVFWGAPGNEVCEEMPGVCRRKMKSESDWGRLRTHIKEYIILIIRVAKFLCFYCFSVPFWATHYSLLERMGLGSSPGILWEIFVPFGR